jgi:hypothetical protein
MLPAGKRIERQDLPGRELETIEFLPSTASQILLGAVEPPADEAGEGRRRRTARQRTRSANQHLRRGFGISQWQRQKAVL